jgi:mono/diheme cytochrome c family protein
MKRIAIYSLASFLTVLLAVASPITEWVVSYDARTRPTLVHDVLDPAQTLEANARAVLVRYCASCHEGEKSGFGFDDADLDLVAMQRDLPLWSLAAEKLRQGNMPPPRAHQPSPAERDTLVQWLEQEVIARAQPARETPAASPSGEAHQLASRLASFLWDASPDEGLLQDATRGTLRQNLEAQVRRMLRDPRSQTLAERFADFWLGLANLDAAQGLDLELRWAMRQETQRFIGGVLREDRSVLELLDADYTYLNEPLARHYGIVDVRGPEMRRVTLPDSKRGGLITQAGILTLITAKQKAPSPVTRGRWALERFLGEPIGKPSPEVIAMQDQHDKPGIRRSQRTTCVECHAKMDPISSTLNHFDAAGQWQVSAPDGTDVFPDGQPARGPQDLRAYLLRNREQFTRTLGEQILSYSLGRRLMSRDRANLQELPASAARYEFRVSRVILAVIQMGWHVGDGDAVPDQAL